MKMLVKKMISIGLALVILATGTMTVSAETTITDDAGNDYWIFGGRMYDDNGQRHTLNNVECYIDIDPRESLELYNAICYAINDWDWHLRYISQTMSEQDGYDYDEYNFGMYNGTNLNNADIRFEKSDDYYVASNGVACSSALAATYYDDALRYQLTESQIINGANWRYNTIVFYMPAFPVSSGQDFIDMARRTANHEIGHALGLAHDLSDNGIIMYPGTYDWTATVPTLHDLMGVYLMYS